MLAGATCHRRARPRPRPAWPTALTALLPRALLSPVLCCAWFSCISSRCRRARRRGRPPPPRCCRLCRHRRHRHRGQRSMCREQRSLRTDALTTSICTPLEPSVSHTFGSGGDDGAGATAAAAAAVVSLSAGAGWARCSSARTRGPSADCTAASRLTTEKGDERQSDALSVTAMRAGGASFLCAAPHCSLGAALGCVHERWRRAHGEWGWEKKKRQLVQRSAAQRTACEVSEHDLDTAAAQAWHTGAPYQC